jgi:hypothetical protein
MNFNEIELDGIRDYFYDSMIMPIAICCTTAKNGNLISIDSFLSDFKEI